MKSTLIYDTEITGHHIEYLSHIIKYIIHENNSQKYIFIVNPDFKERFKELYDISPNVENIAFIEVTRNDLIYLNKGNVLLRSIRNYKFLISIATKFHASKLICLHFNIFILALIFLRNRFDISGILFHQFYRMERKTLLTKFRYFRKYIQTLLLTFNRNISTIFILNDEKTVKFLNRRFNTNTFKVLPDPVPEWVPIPDFSIYEKYNINNARRIFLHIGALDERKGTFEILDSFNFLNRETRKRICLLIIGKANLNTDQVILSKISDLKTRFPEVDIIYKNEFIPNSMMKSLFNQSEFVLIPYKNVEASSGIFGHAIAAGSFIIGSNKGLLGELINSYKQSITLDEIRPESIAIGINKALSESNLNQKSPIWKEFITSHTPVSFARTILFDN